MKDSTKEVKEVKTKATATKKANTTKKSVSKTCKRPDSYRVLGEVLLMLVWVFVSIFAAQFAVGIVMAMFLGDRLNDPVPMACFSALSYALAMLMIILTPPIIKAKYQKKSFSRKCFNRVELGFRGLPTWTDIGLAPVGFAAYFLLASALTFVFSVLFPWFDAGETQEIGFSLYLSGIDRLIAFLTLVIVAPIAEETIFRGWLYGKLRAKFLRSVSDGWSIFFSTFFVSLLFGIVHMQWNVGVNVFAMSIVLCALREITGTIYADIYCIC